MANHKITESGRGWFIENLLLDVNKKGDKIK
jgi:hypothetical protein